MAGDLGKKKMEILKDLFDNLPTNVNTKDEFKKFVEEHENYPNDIHVPGGIWEKDNVIEFLKENFSDEENTNNNVIDDFKNMCDLVNEHTGGTLIIDTDNSINDLSNEFLLTRINNNKQRTITSAQDTIEVITPSDKKSQNVPETMMEVLIELRNEDIIPVTINREKGMIKLLKQSISDIIKITNIQDIVSLVNFFESNKNLFNIKKDDLNVLTTKALSTYLFIFSTFAKDQTCISALPELFINECKKVIATQPEQTEPDPVVVDADKKEKRILSGPLQVSDEYIKKLFRGVI